MRTLAIIGLLVACGGQPAPPAPRPVEPTPAPEPRPDPLALLDPQWRALVERGTFSIGGVSAVPAKSVGEDADPCEGEMHMGVELEATGTYGTGVTLSTEKECEAFIEALASAAKPRRIGKPPYVAIARPGRLEVGPNTPYDVSDSYCKKFECSSDNLTVGGQIVSAVGPIFTVVISESEAGAGGPPYHSESWSTIDMRPGARSVLDAVDEASLVAAIKKDPYLVEEAPDVVAAIASETRWVAIEEKLATAGVSFSGFGFGGYEPNTGLVSLQLAFPDESGMCGMCPNSHSTLGLAVKPHPSMVRFFTESVTVLMDGEPIELR